MLHYYIFLNNFLILKEHYFRIGIMQYKARSNLLYYKIVFLKNSI